MQISIISRLNPGFNAFIVLDFFVRLNRWLNRKNHDFYDFYDFFEKNHDFYHPCCYYRMQSYTEAPWHGNVWWSFVGHPTGQFLSDL